MISFCFVFLKATHESASWDHGHRYAITNIMCAYFDVFAQLSVNIRSTVRITIVSVRSTLPCTHADPSLMFVCVLTDSLSAQRAHTHGRRVRHSSSDSSDSDCSAESASSSLHSRSPSRSPDVYRDPASPAISQQPLCDKEVTALHPLPALRPCHLSVSTSGCLHVNSLQGAVASRRLTAGVGRDGGVGNACELEKRRRVEGRGSFGN